MTVNLTLIYEEIYEKIATLTPAQLVMVKHFLDFLLTIDVQEMESGKAYYYEPDDMFIKNGHFYKRYVPTGQMNGNSTK